MTVQGILLRKLFAVSVSHEIHIVLSKELAEELQGHQHCLHCIAASGHAGVTQAASSEMQFVMQDTGSSKH